MRSPRPATAGAVAALVGVALAGCTPGPPVPDPGSAAVGAVVTEGQAAAIIGRVAEVVGTATAERDPGALAARAAGPARELRASQLEVARILGDDERVTALPMDMQAVVLPSEPGWPRTGLAVSTPPDDTVAPVLYAFEQASARADYKLWAWVKLLKSETLPRFAEPAVGAEAVAADDGESLTMSPAEAVAAYADVLSEEDDSVFAESVEDDEFRALLREQESAQKKTDGWEDSEGRYSFSAERDADRGVRGMRTVDGGAIVLGAIDSSQVIQLQECARVEKRSLTDTQRALHGDQEESNLLRTEYLDVVALYVPAAGSEQRVRLVGVEHVAVDVESAGDMSGCG
ncbi:hypothetical protein [Myceligenerans pegani]|uniref:DUF8094 domain-containing protein n=1 Tax=Myceligenerans pegani TaxID=2776917 RepID=A0ABR9MX11_9MICO|nr:hypothetical protein [Myceligenerans sp. TRM 65318]MBE1875930.1 hypothetical protein [Myceligenerans sp. TRM 65318]MBE3018201.1 hypothetical protein [Myceligenerans sp. TRM 65318]